MASQCEFSRRSREMIQFLTMLGTRARVNGGLEEINEPEIVVCGPDLESVSL